MFDFDAEARYLGRSAVLPLLIAGLLLLPSTVSGEEPSLPPGERPVKVHAGFFLVNLSGVSERSETFDADLYLNFRWQDSRLAFDGFELRRFLEDAAVGRLEEMWWPQLEFVNTAEPKITNRTLEISPDGSVRYEIGMTSEFRTDLDLRRFPFDRQTLEVRIESFLWTDDQMVYAAPTCSPIYFSAAWMRGAAPTTGYFTAAGARLDRGAGSVFPHRRAGRRRVGQKLSVIIAHV